MKRFAERYQADPRTRGRQRDHRTRSHGRVSHGRAAGRAVCRRLAGFRRRQARGRMNERAAGSAVRHLVHRLQQVERALAGQGHFQRGAGDRPRRRRVRLQHGARPQASDPFFPVEAMGVVGNDNLGRFLFGQCDAWRRAPRDARATGRIGQREAPEVVVADDALALTGKEGCDA